MAEHVFFILNNYYYMPSFRSCIGSSLSLKKGQFTNILNRRTLMEGLMKGGVARQVCKDSSKWQAVVTAYP